MSPLEMLELIKGGQTFHPTEVYAVLTNADSDSPKSWAATDAYIVHKASHDKDIAEASRVLQAWEPI